MGIFSGIRRMVGRVVSNVGELFDSEKIAKAGARLEDRANEAAAIIGVLASYDPTKSDAIDVHRVNSALAEFVFEQKKNVRDIEYALIGVLDDFADVVKEILDDEIICAQFESSCEDARMKIYDNISRTISNKMSIADKECLEIMRMRPNRKKQETMRRFANLVQKKAVRKAKIDLEKTLLYLNKKLEEEFVSSYQEKMSLYEHTVRIIREFQRDINKKQDLVSDIDEISSCAKSILSLLNINSSLNNTDNVKEKATDERMVHFSDRKVDYVYTNKGKIADDEIRAKRTLS